MNDFISRYGQWAMVAGAAEGLGAAYCQALARMGINLIMIDVKEEEIRKLSGILQRDHGIKVMVESIDLNLVESADKCLRIIKNHDCHLLVYNAAYSRVKPFLSSSEDELDRYLNVNVRTPLHLVHGFAGMLKSGNQPGGILLMSSLAGIWGTRLVAAYSGTKAFNMLLAEALHHELKPYHIEISACCAGATATPGYIGTRPARGIFGPVVMKPEKVAFIALKNLGKKPVIIPGFSNKINYFILTRMLSRSLSVSIVNRVMASTYRHILK